MWSVSDNLSIDKSPKVFLPCSLIASGDTLTYFSFIFSTKSVFSIISNKKFF